MQYVNKQTNKKVQAKNFFAENGVLEKVPIFQIGWNDFDY